MKEKVELGTPLPAVTQFKIKGFSKLCGFGDDFPGDFFPFKRKMEWSSSHNSLCQSTKEFVKFHFV